MNCSISSSHQLEGGETDMLIIIYFLIANCRLLWLCAVTQNSLEALSL